MSEETAETPIKPDSWFSVRFRTLELGLGWNPDLDAIDNVLLIGSVMGLSLKELRASLGEIWLSRTSSDSPIWSCATTRAGWRLAWRTQSPWFQGRARILMHDEIFAVGDAGFRERCEARYRALSAAGHTVVVVSHSPYTY